MPSEYKQPPGLDLDKTDRLPILEDTQVDPDVADDAVSATQHPRGNRIDRSAEDP